MSAKKKRCGRAGCRDLATHVARDTLFCVYVCDRVEHRPNGMWRVHRLTAPGANTYLAPVDKEGT